jgi:hypothetical protein
MKKKKFYVTYRFKNGYGCIEATMPQKPSWDNIVELQELIKNEYPQCEAIMIEAWRELSHNNAQPVNFALKIKLWICAKLRAFFCYIKKSWSVAKVR